MRTIATIATMALSSLSYIWAAPQGNVIQQVQSTYISTIMDAGGLKVAQKGSILVVQLDGIVAARKKGLSGPYYNQFKNGIIGTDTGPKAMINNHRALNPQPLAVGDKVYLLSVNTGDDSITFHVQTCGTCDPKAVDPGLEPQNAIIAFKFVKNALAGTNFNQVKQVIEKVFKFPDEATSAETDNSAGTAPAPQQGGDPQAAVQQTTTQQATDQTKFSDDPPPPPPPPPPAPPMSIKKEMTIDQVKAILGEPATTVDGGTKVVGSSKVTTLIYLYKSPDFKVTFSNGKVSDFE